MNFICRHIRKKKESLFADPERKAAFMPSDKISEALVICDRPSAETDEALEDIRQWAAKYGIGLFILYFSITEKGKTPNGQQADSLTVCKNDIGLFKIPRLERLESILRRRFDILICATPATSYPVEFTVKCCTASFKAGIEEKREGLFDLLVAGNKGCKEKISFLLNTLSKIKNED